VATKSGELTGSVQRQNLAERAWQSPRLRAQGEWLLIDGILGMRLVDFLKASLARGECLCASE